MGPRGEEQRPMALAQFVQVNGERITKRMFTPKKKMTDPLQWYKDARKLIKELPQLSTAPVRTKEQWRLICEPETSVRWIKFTLENGIGEKAHLVIDRTASSLGGN